MAPYTQRTRPILETSKRLPWFEYALLNFYNLNTAAFEKHFFYRLRTLLLTPKMMDVVETAHLREEAGKRFIV